MKNCPWFSLRSNSIELRYAQTLLNFAFAQFVGAIFKLIPDISHQKKRNSEFASLISFFILAALDLDANRFN